MAAFGTGPDLTAPVAVCPGRSRYMRKTQALPAVRNAAALADQIARLATRHRSTRTPIRPPGLSGNTKTFSTATPTAVAANTMLRTTGLLLFTVKPDDGPSSCRGTWLP